MKKHLRTGLFRAFFEEDNETVDVIPGTHRYRSIQRGGAPASPVKAPQVAASKQERAPPSSWSAEEDAALTEMVRERGADQWQEKASRFPTNRSSDALRNRWQNRLRSARRGIRTFSSSACFATSLS